MFEAHYNVTISYLLVNFPRDTVVCRETQRQFILSSHDSSEISNQIYNTYIIQWHRKQ